MITTQVRAGLLFACFLSTTLMASAADPRVGPRTRHQAWGQQSAFGSTWTNGLSLYGPPIPTYASTPGTFNNRDLSLFFFYTPPPFGFDQSRDSFSASPWFGYGFPIRRPDGTPIRFKDYFAPLTGPGSVGWASTFHPEAMPRSQARVPQVSVIPQTRALSVVVTPSVEVGQCIRVVVTLPEANADLWVQNTTLSQTGTERVFESPELESGKRYTYEIIARWRSNGREHAETRTVTATAGQLARVNFTIPAE
ncbi:MAG: TIGR03000 domain-containing protein [Fimbriiglobus sp.]